MELTVSKKDLLRVVERCQGVADKKSTMPVLSNVLLAASDDGRLRVAATDLYISVSGLVAAEVKTSGSIAVPAKELYERVNAMPDGPIRLIGSEGSQLWVRSVAGARGFKLHGVPGSDFPNLPEPDANGPALELGVDVLASLIGTTHFSISAEETRAALNSALFEWDGDWVRMVTTDGHRLSKMEVQVKERQATATMLIPAKAINELKRVSDAARNEAGKEGREIPKVRIAQSGPNAFFELVGMRYSVKLVDAQFPPYSQVIPQTTDLAFKLPRVTFADALKAVSLASSEKTGGVKLTFANGKMRITSESPESGEGYDELPVDYEGAEVAMGFNARYLRDVLQAIDDDDIVLGVGGDLDPAVIKPATEREDRNYKAVVMPMLI